MSRNTSMVAIILDEQCSKLRDLSEQMAVWVVDTPANRAVMTELWKQAEAPSNDLTLFKTTSGLSGESQLLSKVPTIELHHPEATGLLLIGMDETYELREGLLGLGYSLQKRGNDLLATKSDTVE